MKAIGRHIILEMWGCQNLDSVADRGAGAARDGRGAGCQSARSARLPVQPRWRDRHRHRLRESPGHPYLARTRLCGRGHLHLRRPARAAGGRAGAAAATTHPERVGVMEINRGQLDLPATRRQSAPTRARQQRRGARVRPPIRPAIPAWTGSPSRPTRARAALPRARAAPPARPRQWQSLEVLDLEGPGRTLILAGTLQTSLARGVHLPRAAGPHPDVRAPQSASRADHRRRRRRRAAPRADAPQRRPRPGSGDRPGSRRSRRCASCPRSATAPTRTSEPSCASPTARGFWPKPASASTLSWSIRPIQSGRPRR